jgi:hypothetical protein
MLSNFVRKIYSESVIIFIGPETIAVGAGRVYIKSDCFDGGIEYRRFFACDELVKRFLFSARDRSMSRRSIMNRCFKGIAFDGERSRFYMPEKSKKRHCFSGRMCLVRYLRYN